MFPSQALQFIINVQHDCAASRCEATEDVACIQERQETTKTRKVIKHCDNAHFIINTHALHNAAQLRQFLPRYLTVPRPLYGNRRKRHDELGAVLIVTQAEKKAETARKAAETRRKRKEATASKQTQFEADKRSRLS